MRFFTDKTIKAGLSASLFAAGLTGMVGLVINSATASPNVSNNQSITYTASGKTDRQTAKLFKQLMQNNPNIQVSAQIVKRADQTNQSSKPGSVSVNYSLKGTTDVKTARKLIRLFKNSRHIDVVANINSRKHNFTFQPKARSRPYMRQYKSHRPHRPYYYGAPQGYQAVLLQPVSQPMIWYRVPDVHTTNVSQQTAYNEPRYIYL